MSAAEAGSSSSGAFFGAKAAARGRGPFTSSCSLRLTTRPCRFVSAQLLADAWRSRHLQPVEEGPGRSDELSRAVELPTGSGILVRYQRDLYYDANNNLVGLHMRISGQSILAHVLPSRMGPDGRDPATFQGLNPGGEFQFAAWNFSVVHPTGYPLYLTLGHLWSKIPLGDVGFRGARRAECDAQVGQCLTALVEVGGPDDLAALTAEVLDDEDWTMPEGRDAQQPS